MNDAFAGRTSSEWIPPPRTVYTLRVFLSTLENINLSATRLFATSFTNVPLEGDMLFSTLGSKANTPLILVSDILPEDEMEPGTEHFLVPPELHLTPRLCKQSFIYIFFLAIIYMYPSQCIMPFLLSMVHWHPNLLLMQSNPGCLRSTLILFRLWSLWHPWSKGLVRRRRLTVFLNCSRKNAVYPFNGDYFPANDGYWPGSTVENPIMLEFPVRRPLKIAESAVYFIHNCLSNRPLAMSSNRACLSGSYVYSEYVGQNVQLKLFSYSQKNN